MKLKHIVMLTSLAFAGNAFATDVEVLHYWTSGSEAKSVGQLQQIVKEDGFGWKDFAVAGGAGENAATALKTRVISGNPPTAAQLKGPSIQEWGKEGVLANIDDAAAAGKWDAVLPKVVADIMKYKGHYVAAPVNVHRVNWMWANPDVLKKAGVVGVPATWDAFFDAAEKIKKSGGIAIAHGGQPWQDATVFESVALGVGGTEFYKKALIKLDQKELTSPTMVKVFDTLGKVKGYIDKDAAGRDWNLATAMVINGKAGFQFMGDWAKGEFSNAGKIPGRDYICAAAPGTDKAYTFNVDSFAMFTQKDAEAKKGQFALATAIMNPKFQAIFNLNKGSIPVRSGVSRAKFDDCAIKSMEDMDATNKSGGLVPSFAHGMALPSATQGAVVDVIAKFMNSNMSSKDAVAALAKAAKVK
ncbi:MULTISPECIES: ABC transporter substrate-binding protein [unclassified Janthinobacterium]|uniref:ABC transporter substrate-binding protein n=1 Tax=unclassified Janthinobacterium TaxID=2610881 RepID=UPI0003499546|nr:MULTISPECIES: ABC transporter substrate-binding protein [unclassified Janthinobacterium]MEC5162658.1 glucose/mannose transport system substrate-binding protein [Janthinobacterium sp. CG_S6]